MRIFTIGFTKSTAESFFTRLCDAGVKRLLDVRLNNVSQLAGFAKKSDLPYFLRAIGNIGYDHRLELAPTQEILTPYKKQRGEWEAYERQFLSLLQQRAIQDTLPRPLAEDARLLCSENTPHHCHRRLVAECLAQHWGDVEIVHL